MKFQVCNNRYYGKIEDDGTQKIIEWSERGNNPPAELPDNAVVAEWNSITEVGDLQTLVNDLTENSSFDEVSKYLGIFPHSSLALIVLTQLCTNRGGSLSPGLCSYISIVFTFLTNNSDRSIDDTKEFSNSRTSSSS